jgi:hypothetical protein
MNLSYQEKSIWVSLVSTLIVFGYYFLNAMKIFNNSKIENLAITGLFIGTVIILIIIQIVFQSIIAIINRKEAQKGEDERDNLIELKATRISYFIIVLGVWVTALSFLILSSTIIMANTIMFFFILAEIVGYIIQLIYYRRGI